MLALMPQRRVGLSNWGNESYPDQSDRQLWNDSDRVSGARVQFIENVSACLEFV